MTNKEVAEAFAKGIASGKSLHMFIEGNCVYSYGYHFMIARRHWQQESTFPVILFTERGYSRTTTKHKNLVRLALRMYAPAIRIISVNDPSQKINLPKEVVSGTMLL